MLSISNPTPPSLPLKLHYINTYTYIGNKYTTSTNTYNNNNKITTIHRKQTKLEAVQHKQNTPTKPVKKKKRYYKLGEAGERERGA